MLAALRLGKLKLFADAQRPMRPLSLICGANSAGKSCIVHTLVLARHGLPNMSSHLVSSRPYTP